jgi:hypothetical protein
VNGRVRGEDPVVVETRQVGAILVDRRARRIRVAPGQEESLA